ARSAGGRVDRWTAGRLDGGTTESTTKRMEKTMQYSLLIYQTSDQFAARTDPARRDANTAAFMSFVGALQEAGVLVTTRAIEPAHTAATVRVASGAPRVHDGPYADTKEQLGGV